MPPTISTAGIILKTDDSKVQQALKSVQQVLDSHGIKSMVHTNDIEHPEQDRKHYQTIGEHCELCIVIGGDGTLLHAARELAPHNTPILGVNLGRLGFLVDISPDEITPRLEEYLQGAYNIEKRSLLEVRIEGQANEHPLLALNDLVLHKWELARMIEFQARIDHTVINDYRADGIVIATPTGSTAYSLSAGGPIIHPAMHAITLVPICPHTLNNRPLVIPADSHISLELKSGNTEHTMLTLDGQTRIRLQDDARIHIQSYAQPIALIHPKDHHYFDILRAKLRWGTQTGI